MKFVYLVARREFAEHAKTKGFWIGILLMPLFLFLSIRAPIWLHEKGTPVRHFVLVDQSGEFAPVVDAALEWLHQTKVFDALKDYAVRQGLKIPEGATRSVESFSAQGGAGPLLEQLRSNLKPGAP